jgi:hypothetical protein
MGSVPPHGIHCHMDRPRRRKRRHLDVQRCIRVADDQSRSRKTLPVRGAGSLHALKQVDQALSRFEPFHMNTFQTAAPKGNVAKRAR